MKVFISVDMEGVSGLTDPEEMRAGGRGYERGCELMTGDANAAVRAAFDAGADQVVVTDSHGRGKNLRADLIGTGVRATNIAPGLCGGTEFSNVRLKDDAAAAKVYEGTTPLTADDIANTAFWIATLPQHINVNSIELMPTCQGFSPFAIKRG